MGNAPSALPSEASVSLPNQPWRQSPLPPIKKGIDSVIIQDKPTPSSVSARWVLLVEHPNQVIGEQGSQDTNNLNFSKTALSVSHNGTILTTLLPDKLIWATGLPNQESTLRPVSKWGHTDIQFKWEAQLSAAHVFCSVAAPLDWAQDELWVMPHQTRTGEPCGFILTRASTQPWCRWIISFWLGVRHGN